MTTHITPYLPPAAEQQVKAWERMGGPVFIAALRRCESDVDACPNCGGVGGLYVYFMDKGWHESPNPALTVVSKYFDGDNRFHRGWYNVSRVETYPCPHCEKHPKPDKPYVLPPGNVIAQLSKKLGSKEQLDASH
jgi:hypothetical protein